MLADGSNGGKIRKTAREQLSELGKGYDLEAACEMETPPAVIIDMVLKDTGYRDCLTKKDNIEDRESNIEFLISYANEFDLLSEFTQEFALASKRSN